MFETNGHPLGGFWFFKQKMKTIQKNEKQNQIRCSATRCNGTP